MSKKIYKGDDLTRKQKLSNRVTKEEKDQDGNVKAFSDEKVYNGKHVEPPFIKLYLDDIEILYKLPKKSSQFMHELLKNMNYEGEITINSRLKERISEKLELTNVRSMNNYLTDMVNKDMLDQAKPLYEICLKDYQKTMSEDEARKACTEKLKDGYKKVTAKKEEAAAE